jgi:aspartyl-tRNA(Asn)/glutamyl-tRNA(Gln) amidotransferase subunit C
MSSAEPPVTAETVRRIAELARLEVGEEELPVFAVQLARIISYIDQLKEIPEEAFEKLGSAGPTPLRSDEPRAGEGLAALEANAPRTVHGFGVVPRVVGAGSEPA